MSGIKAAAPMLIVLENVMGLSKVLDKVMSMLRCCGPYKIKVLKIDPSQLGMSVRRHSTDYEPQAGSMCKHIRGNRCETANMDAGFDSSERTRPRLYVCMWHEAVTPPGSTEASIGARAETLLQNAQK